MHKPKFIMEAKIYHCLRCNNSWKSKKSKKEVKRCGVCKSPYWNKPLKPRNQFMCVKCEHIWKSPKKQPERCAKCNNPNWNKRSSKQIIKEIVRDFY